MTIEPQIEQHYISRFGQPTRNAEFVPRKGPAIRIWKWDESSSKEGVAIYATLGASSSLVGDEQRCEFFLGLQPEVDDVAASLAELALKGVGNGKVPCAGDTVTLAGPLWPGTSMRTFLIASQREEVIPRMPHPRTVVFIMLVPLHASELEYKVRQGESSLWEIFRNKTTPYWNPLREPAI